MSYLRGIERGKRKEERGAEPINVLACADRMEATRFPGS
jgi:hypothetical protein